MEPFTDRQTDGRCDWGLWLRRKYEFGVCGKAEVQAADQIISGCELTDCHIWNWEYCLLQTSETVHFQLTVIQRDVCDGCRTVNFSCQISLINVLLGRRAPLLSKNFIINVVLLPVGVVPSDQQLTWLATAAWHLVAFLQSWFHCNFLLQGCCVFFFSASSAVRTTAA